MDTLPIPTLIKLGDVGVRFDTVANFGDIGFGDGISLEEKCM